MVEQIDIVGNRGLCGGVKMAFEGLDQVLRIVQEYSKTPRSVYLTWDLVNNNPVMDLYRQRGVLTFEDLVDQAAGMERVVNDPWELVPRRSVVGISAHGDQPQYFTEAHKRDCYLVNLACQLVKRVNRLGEEADKEDMLVFYAGKVYPPDIKHPKGIIHPETASNLARIKPENQVLLDETRLKDKSAEELREYLEGLRLAPERAKIALSQTTLSPRYLDRLYEAIAQVYPETTFKDRVKGDLCPAMRNRSTAAYAAIPDIDLWLVVGSKRSHNSQELRESGTEAGVPSYSVDFPDEVEPGWFNLGIKRVGVTSGASVPYWVMDPVIDRLVKFNPQARINRLPQVVLESNKTFVLPQKEIDGLKDWLLSEVI